ncbi:689_t:CDS:2 [Acaulospora colombiana]|uniref:689_t:CDS:1 n=1 Tax=Acaulospora colombiana TaxID=27376 RepID=A0ACA9MEE0_9GLOM|nr:689_t:CDS:2 [Acaulospora colombiana]
MSSATPSSQDIDFDSIDFDKINFEQIDVDKLDLADSGIILSLLQTPPKPALSICPVEIWSQTISYIDDIFTLTSLNLTCMTLREISRDPLLLRLVREPPLDRLYEFTRDEFLREKYEREEKNNNMGAENENSAVIEKKKTPKEKFDDKRDLKEVIFKMHKYVDRLLLSDVGPDKWTDNVFEWVGYDENKDVTTNREIFRREAGRIGKAKTKAFVDWEARIENEKKIMRRELARVWTIAGKMFPFSHAENREWKRKRLERTQVDENSSSPPSGENKENVASQQRENKSIRGTKKLESKPKHFANFQDRNVGSSTAGSGSKERRSDTRSSSNSDEPWKYSHEIRNQLKAKRPNLDKGEKEFKRQISTPFVTPTYFSYGRTFEDLRNEDLTNFMIKIMKRFCESGEQVLRFPCELTGYQRKRLHRQAELLELNSVSFGDGEGRFLVAMKQDVELLR